MTTLGMSGDSQMAVWRALAAALHLGCVAAPPPTDGAFPASAELSAAARLLGCQPDALGRALGGGAAAAARREAAGALRQPDALATWLSAVSSTRWPEALNAALSRACAASAGGGAVLELAAMPYICVFEAPPPSTPAPGTAVGLSHMIESYAAEKTHARMCDAMRDALRSQPEAEGIEPPQLPLPGTSSAELLALFDGPSGLLHLLGECEAAPPAASAGPSSLEAHLLSRLRHAHSRSPLLALPPATAGAAPTFGVRHFHGELQYDAAALLSGLRRGADPSEAVLLVVQASSSPPLRSLLATRGGRGGASARVRRGAASASVAGAAASRFGELLQYCDAGATLHALCIHPAPAGGRVFDGGAVRAQLAALGVPLLAPALGRGLVERMEMAAFVGRYRSLAPINSARLMQSFLLHSAAHADELRQGCEALVATLPLRSDECAVGRRCVLLRAGRLAHLERLRAVRLSAVAPRVAAAARGLRVRSAYRRLREAGGRGGRARRCCRCVRVSRRRVPTASCLGGRRHGEARRAARLFPSVAAPLLLPCCQRARRRRRGAAATVTVPRAVRTSQTTSLCVRSSLVWT